MSLLKKLFGFKESRRVDGAEGKLAQPSVTSHPLTSPTSKTISGAAADLPRSFDGAALFRESNLEEVRALLESDPALALSKDNDGKTPLHWAAFNGSKEVAEMLLASKADVDSKDNNGQTPLHFAASYRSLGLRFSRVQMVKLLLASKADVDSKDNTGYTPLRAASVRGHEDVAELLRQHGGDESI